MIDLRVKGDGTKSRLMEATERLIAEKGFDAVSVRDITGLAKANVAAVNYHFGSREGLLGALLEQRMKQVFADRAQGLESLSDAASVRQMFEVWAGPLFHLAPRAGMDEATQARVLGRCLEATAADLYESVRFDGARVDFLMKRMLESRLRGWESTSIAWRFHFVQGALIHALIHGSAVHAEFSLASLLGQWVDAAAAQFSQAGDGDARDASIGNHAKNPRKNVSSAPLRQIAEVVAAAMEVAETPTPQPPVAAFSEELAPSVTPHHDVPVESPTKGRKSSRSKKAKVDDGMEELFLL